MARARMIKPDRFRDKQLACVEPAARWTYAGLECYADDHGRLPDDIEAIKADVYLRDPGMTPDVIEKHLGQLADAELICRYEVGGYRYLHLVNFHRDQDPIKYPSKPRYPGCPVDHEVAGTQGSLFPPNQYESPPGHTQGSVKTRSGLGEVSPDKAGNNGSPAIPTDQGGVSPSPDHREERFKRGFKNHSEPGGSPPTPKQRSYALAAAYCRLVKLSNKDAVAKIALKAIDSGEYPDDRIAAALISLAEQRRTVTAGSLLTELEKSSAAYDGPIEVPNDY